MKRLRLLSPLSTVDQDVEDFTWVALDHDAHRTTAHSTVFDCLIGSLSSVDQNAERLPTVGTLYLHVANQFVGPFTQGQIVILKIIVHNYLVLASRGTASHKPSGSFWIQDNA